MYVTRYTLTPHYDICALGDDLHLFECDDTTPED